MTAYVVEMSIIKTLSDIDHVLCRPAMYVGDTHVRNTSKLILDHGVIVEKDIITNSALERIFLEIVYNAADNVERSMKNHVDPGKIVVVVKNDTVMVRNEGNPFPIGEEIDGMYDPERALGLLKSGSNFDDTGRKVSGMNGVGASLTNIFSTVFDVDVYNNIEKKRLHLQWRSNMRKLVKKEISDYEGPSYTKITYIADFSRFYDDDVEFECAGIRYYSDDMIRSMAKHCMDVSLTTGVPVEFNGHIFDITDIRTYASYIWPEISSMNTISLEHEDTKCLLIDTLTGRSISFVNGIYVQRGGVHVDAWQRAVTKPILPALKKLGLTARSAYKHVFKSISMIIVSRYSNIEFSEQVKDRLISPVPTVPHLDTSGLVRWEGIIAMAKRIKAIASTLANVSSKNDGKKAKMLSMKGLKDAHLAGGAESHRCTLFLCEGSSASNFVAKAIDGQTQGSLSLGGKVLNVSKADKDSYESNDIIRLLNRALGLKENTDYSGSEFSKLRYGKVTCLFDADVDGQHIIGLIYNFLRSRYPSLLERNFINVMQTPLIRVTANNKKYQFFSSNDYREWCERNPSVKHKANYYKGLSSSNDEEVKEAFQSRRIVEYKWDEHAEDNTAMAFDDGNSDARKKWVLSWDPHKGISSMAAEYTNDSFSHFIYHELCEFSHYNVQRSIPSLIDGLKRSQRQILAVVMKMKSPLKISQLKGRVSDLMNYRHGEDSLYHAIVCMGDYYIGSNNIPLINAIGQYHSRQGGKPGSDRYIKAEPSKVLPFIFRSEDSIILEHRIEDGDEVEPYNYYPIIPIFAVNGSTGIGSGFSVSIPPHSPVDIMRYIAWWLKRHTGEDSITPPPELKPYYFGYRGKMYKKDEGWYSEGAYSEVPSRLKIKDIRITELPITLTINSYLKKLDGIISKSDRKMEYKDSAKSYDYRYKGVLRTEVVPDIIVSGFIPVTDEPLRELGLIEKIPINSIVLLDENSIPRVYSDDLYASLSDYCLHRYDAYSKRMRCLISMWRDKIAVLEKKKQYMRDVIDGVIVFRDNNRPKKKQVLIQEILDRGYKESFLKISALSLTEEGIESIDEEIRVFQSKIDKYEKSTPSSLWREELKELHTYLYKC